MAKKMISILFPEGELQESRVISDTAWHDLGMDTICEKLTGKVNERTVIASIMKTMTADPETARYRAGVFCDIVAQPKMRSRMMELLDHVQFLNDYGSFRKDHDMRVGLWELLHRLSELDDYIKSVEQIRDCLDDADVHSDGLKALRAYVQEVHEESLFEELKTDIGALKADVKNLRSVTIGVNLNRNFEVDSIGLISVNNKEFKSSGILNNFSEALATKEGIRDGNKWNGSMRFHPVTNSSADFTGELGRIGAVFAAERNPLMLPLIGRTLAATPEKDSSRYVTHFFDREISSMLSLITRRLEQGLSKYVNFSIGSIVGLIPEFMYYIRWAEFMEKLKERGYAFCTPEVPEEPGDLRMRAKGVYNLKLAVAGELEPSAIVPNDLVFDKEHTCYILTGANRGGKTTITQAVGQLFVLGQGGICVPGESFAFQPADCIYTHYPADEDSTMDLGRLGEECSRFKEIYGAGSGKSLLLLNETFSTTSFEEGYYIARDAVKAILKRGMRTIYNTHMHKLAMEIDEINAESDGAKAASLVAETKDGERSFKLRLAAPEGRSYAEDIAIKYGVTYAMLTGEEQ
ncbi:MAG: DNA mismatch repair protein [Lachnospiraceae bacterium]|nr:DNA mismatch repair protein [Lachnospiraceae bacterium]